MDRILDPLCVRTTVRRIKDIRGETIPYPDENWKTDLPFPVSIMEHMDHLNT
jgi:hypothetical protein